jgi:hypothetical protein
MSLSEPVVSRSQPIYFVTQNVTTVNLAVTSEFNYDLIMLKEILINKFHLFQEYFLLIHYLNAVKYKAVKFNVILGFV